MGRSANAEFPKVLGELIATTGHTQSDIARVIGVHRAVVCDWLRGRCAVRDTHAEAVAELMGLAGKELLRFRLAAAATHVPRCWRALVLGKAG